MYQGDKYRVLKIVFKSSVAILLLLLLLPFNAAFAQKQGKHLVDSLLLELPHQLQDTNKVKLLEGIANAYVNVSRESGIKYALEAESISKNIAWKAGEAEALRILGVHYSSNRNYPMAQDYLSKSLAIFQQMKMKEKIAEVLRLSARAYYSTGNFEKAFDCNFQALKINEALERKKEIGFDEVAISTLYNLHKEYDKAKEWGDKAINIGKEINDYNLIVSGLVAVSYVYVEKFDTVKTIEYARNALNYCDRMDNKFLLTEAYTSVANLLLLCGAKTYHSVDEINNSEPLRLFLKSIELMDAYGYKIKKLYTLVNIGNLYKRNKMYVSSLDYYQKTLALAKQEDDQFYVAASFSNIGAVYRDLATGWVIPMEDTFKKMSRKTLLTISRDNFQHAIDAYEKINNYQYLQDCYFSIALIDYQLANYQKAFLEYQTFTSIKDSLFSAASTANISSLETQREKELQQKQIEINKLEKEKRQNERRFYIAGLVLLVIVVVIMTRNYRIQKKLNGTITMLVNEQENTIKIRTKELAGSNEKLFFANNKLVELIQYNAHNLREPLTRISGAMLIKEYLTNEEFFVEVWPQMAKAVTDLDNSIQDVIHIADETVGANA